VVVHIVQVVLQLANCPLGKLAQNLVHALGRDVVGEHVKNKAVCSAQLKVLESPSTHLPCKNGPREVGHHDPGKSVDHAQDGHPDEEEPPDPDDKKVLLVEEVVTEDAKIVARVHGTSRGTDID